MKKIINGKTYNTGTAKEIGYFHNGLSRSDFRYREETLYKTRKGRFFLAGEGGAMTWWAKSNGNTSWGSSGIRVIDEKDALDWCECHDIDVDVIVEHFEIEEA